MNNDTLKISEVALTLATDFVTDKRNETRIQCNKPVQIILTDDSIMEMTVLNYSMGGVGITGSVYQVIPNIGEKLEVQFTLGGDKTRSVNVSGVVKYINLEAGAYYLGIGL